LDFKQWVEMSAIQDILKNVPQSNKFHPEGPVGVHVRMVREALSKAISLMQNAIRVPNSIFSNFDPEYSSREINILRLSAWLHDLGKASATAYTQDDGTRTPLKDISGGKSGAELQSPDFVPFTGKGEKGWQAIDHEDLSHLISGFRKLKTSPIWNKLYKSTNSEDRHILMFLIRNHMTKFGKGDQNKWIDDNGKYKNDPKIKLLLTFVLMDHMGRGNIGKGEQLDFETMTQAAIEKKNRATRIQINANVPGDIEGFIDWMKQQKKPISVMRLALRGKFNYLTDLEIEELIGG
jgi:hypothetical protein